MGWSICRLSVKIFPTGYSLRASDSLTVPRFISIYGKNSIAHRGSAGAVEYFNF